jgi:hypothetical protein
MSRLGIRRAERKAIVAAVIFFFAASSLHGDTLTNEQLCSKGVARLSDSLVQQLDLDSIRSVTVAAIEGRFAQQFLDRLTSKLGDTDVTPYLQITDVPTKRPMLQAGIDDFSLSYRGVHSGLFSNGSVVREFRIAGYCRLLESDGRLLRSAAVRSLVVDDTVSYDEARLAYGNDAFLSPHLPPSLYQRLVEPGLIVGIAGALVYLFFASR